MKKIIFFFLFSSAAPLGAAFADSSYYCNGSTKRSEGSWYYPNGSTAQSGTTVYYPNGATLRSGESMYYRNGSVLKSTSDMYYLNGGTLKNGNSFYYTNTSPLKINDRCYYSNGSSMGSCPSIFGLSLGSQSNEIDLNLNLAAGEVMGFVYRYRTSSNDRPVALKLEKTGLIEEISYSCVEEEPEVRQILLLYQNLPGEKKSNVRKEICGP